MVHKALAKEIPCSSCPGCFGPCNNGDGTSSCSQAIANRVQLKPLFTGDNEFMPQDAGPEEACAWCPRDQGEEANPEDAYTWCPKAGEIAVEEVVIWNPGLDPDAAGKAPAEAGGNAKGPPRQQRPHRQLGCAPPILSRWVCDHATASTQTPATPSDVRKEADPGPVGKDVSRRVSSRSVPSEQPSQALLGQAVNPGEGAAPPWRPFLPEAIIQGPVSDEFVGFLEAGSLDDPTPSQARLQDTKSFSIESLKSERLQEPWGPPALPDAASDPGDLEVEPPAEPLDPGSIDPGVSGIDPGVPGIDPGFSGCSRQANIDPDPVMLS